MNFYCLNIETCGNGLTGGVGFSIGFSSPHAINSAIGKRTLSWINQVEKLVREEGDLAFNPSSDEANRSIERLVAGLRGLNRIHPYLIATLDGVPAVQQSSLDGRKIDIDFVSDVDKPVIHREHNFSTRQEAVECSGLLRGIGGHRRGEFDFQPPLHAQNRTC